MASSAEHDQCDEDSFKYFLNEHHRSVKSTHDDGRVKRSSYEHNWRQKKALRGPKLQGPSIPYLKFFMLRGSHNNDQMVEFHEHQDGCNRYRDDNNEDPFYIPYLADSHSTFDHEIDELALILKDWFDRIVVPNFDQSQFSDLLSTIRYGHAYFTKLCPFVDQMSVAQFKDHFNRLSPYAKSKNSSYRINTAFYPIYENFDCDISKNTNFQLLSFEKECESYRVAFAVESCTHTGRTYSRAHYYADFDSKLELILSATDVKYLNVDLKNAPGNPDIRICFSCTDDTRPQPFASKLKDYSNGKSPILRKNIHTGVISITKNYAQHVSNVRYKKQKIYKLRNCNELWDDFRKTTLVKIVTIIEYVNIDEDTGEFGEIHKKNEITIDTPLSDLLSRATCHRLAENLLKLSIDIIPNSFS